MTPEMRAAGLVQVVQRDAPGHPDAVLFQVSLAGKPISRVYGDADSAEEIAASLRDAIVTIIRAAEADLLRLDLGEPPVSEERLAEIRDLAKDDYATVAWTQELLALIDHQRRLLAALMREPGDYQAGYEAGKAAAARGMLAELRANGGLHAALIVESWLARAEQEVANA